MVCPGVDGENLALRALRGVPRRDRLGRRRRSGSTITKRIPIAAGMAGGSSDAAAALRLASQASGLAIPPDLPMRLGADVPVMLAGDARADDRRGRARRAAAAATSRR